MSKIRSRGQQPSTSARAKAPRFFFVVIGCLTLLPSLAHAERGDLATRWRVNDDNPSASIPTDDQRNADPLEFGAFLQDLIARAEGGFDARDYAKAVKYYEALAKTVPGHALSFSRLCYSYAELGKLEVAIANCQKAVRLDGARVLDHFRLVSLLMQKKELKVADVDEIDASLAQLQQHADKQAALAQQNSPAPMPTVMPKLPTLDGKSPEQVRAQFEALAETQAKLAPKSPVQTPAVKDLPLEIEVLACRVGVRLNDPERLRQCVQRLESRRADPRLLVPFEWARALVTKDRAQATALLDKASKLDFPATTMQAMLAEQKKTFGSLGALDFFARWGALALLGIVALGAGIVLARRFSSPRPRPTPS